MRKLRLLAVAACAVVFLSSAQSALAQFRLDHFKAYEVEPVRVELTVTLKGQFDKAPVKHDLTELSHFANAAIKNRGVIQDKHAHLNWYALKGEKEPERTVIVENQFGKQTLVLGQPRFLLVPAAKKEGTGELSERLDHFKCYEVLKGEPADKRVVLKDQFGSQDGIAVRLPRLFCVPVEKTYKDRTHKINNPVDHLTVYDIRTEERLPRINVADQFTMPATRPLTVVKAVYLCVPSKKTLVPPNGNGDPVKLDHFRFYITEKIEHSADPSLRGQFDDTVKEVKLGLITHFANPVSKNGAKILDKNAHLTFHRYIEPVNEPKRLVALKNQFGKQKIVTGDSIALLVPSEKVERGSAFPELLDHYKVYEVLEGESIDRAVKLEDQFPPAREVEVARPRLFCVPVLKRHNNKVHEIKNKEAHITIYETTATPDARVTKEVRNQFGDYKLRILRGVWLGVPTEKVDFKVLD